MKTITTTCCVLSLVLLAACGGGGGSTSDNSSTDQPTYATTLSYQNPGATGFRLVQNATASSSTRLVLDLLGPSGTPAKGVAFFLGADNAKVTWVHPTGASGTVVAPGSVFPLGASPKLAKDKVQGGQLQVGLFQKGGAATTLGDAPILSLALVLNGTQVPKGAVSLGPQSGKQAVVLDGNGNLANITISVGALSAQ